MGTMQSLPAELQEEVFRRFFEAAESARFNPEKREKYISEMFTQDDYINEIETARENGEIKGRDLANRDIVLSMNSKGLSAEQIAEFTGLTIDVVKQIIP